MVIAIDFDGTITDYIGYKEGEYGNIKPGAKQLVNKLTSNGHKVVIWTARKDSEHKDILNFLMLEGFEFYSINESQTLYDYENSTKKILADLYIDDRAIKFTDWADVNSQLKKQGVL